MDDKIILTSKLEGGIGNKLFQISVIVGLAKRNGVTWVLDENHIEAPKYNHTNYRDTIFSRCNFMKGVKFEEKYKESDYKYSEFVHLREPKVNTFYEGYFQNESYFIDCKKDIINLFKPGKKMKAKLRKMFPKCNESYFLHIRTYFVTKVSGELEDSTYFHQINLLKYYTSIIDNIKDSHVYVLMDNKECAEKMYSSILSRLDWTYVDGSDVELLYLMSLCWKGGVCSNSSFSWWGSYLNENPDKKVWMPSRWLPRVDWKCDIYPKGVTIVDV